MLDQRALKGPTGAVGLFFGPEDDLSLADQVALLGEAERSEALDGLDHEKLQWDHGFWLRPSQLALVNSTAWMSVALAGRGWGKSHVLSVAMHKYAMENPGSRLLLVGRTTSDVRDVMINGNSGILSVVDPSERPKWNPGTRKLTWDNGTIALCYSAERPDSLRGIQAHASFCDEVAAYRSNPGAGLANAFDQIKLLTRLSQPDGRPPQIFVATTPKRVPMTIDLVNQANEDGPDRVLLVRGPTSANRALSEEYRQTVEGMYANTTIGRQELEGELLTDVEGALLHQDTIDDNRHVPDPTAGGEWWRLLPNRVIGVDPSVSSAPNDECGIIAVGATGERRIWERQAYVLEDASMLGSPDEWAKVVVKLARKYQAIVVAEKNQGGEMVRLVLKAADPHVPVILVHAAVSKFERAEPVGAAYERGAVHHVGEWPELEAQLTSWAPDMGMASPDRMDAVVHAVTSLLIAKSKDTTGTIRAAPRPTGHLPVADHNPAHRYGADMYARSSRSTEQQPQLPPRKRPLPIASYAVGRGSYAGPNRAGQGMRK